MHAHLRPSRTLIGLFILVYSGTFLIWWYMLPIPIWARCNGTVIHSIHLYYVIRRHLLLKSPHAITAFGFTHPNKWIIQLQQGTVLSAQLTHHSVCLRHIILLNFKLNEIDQSTRHRSRTLLICSDSMTSDEFRAWQRHLRLLK